MLIIRPAQNGDYSAIKSIAASNMSDNQPVKIAKPEIYANAVQDPKSNTVLVAAEYSLTQGFLRATHRKDGVTILQEMAVLPLRRGHGLGTAMFNVLAQKSRELGMKRMNLLVPTTSRSNAWFKHRGCEYVDVKSHQGQAHNLYFFGLK